MKIIFALLLVLSIPNFGSCTSSITVFLSNCRAEHITKRGTIRVFKNSKLIQKSRQFKTIVDNLDEGIYQIEYTTLVEKKRTIEIELKPNENKTLTLCSDDFDYHRKTSISMVDALIEGTSMEIVTQFKSQKKRHSDTLGVTRIGSDYYLKYKNCERIMNELDIEIFREFEYFVLNFRGTGISLKKHTYVLSNSLKKWKRKVNTKTWNGFYYLLVDLKLTTIAMSK